MNSLYLILFLLYLSHNVYENRDAKSVNDHKTAETFSYCSNLKEEFETFFFLDSKIYYNFTRKNIEPTFYYETLYFFLYSIFCIENFQFKVSF